MREDGCRGKSRMEGRMNNGMDGRMKREMEFIEGGTIS
jgi:hypothetical protein